MKRNLYILALSAVMGLPAVLPAQTLRRHSNAPAPPGNEASLLAASAADAARNGSTRELLVKTPSASGASRLYELPQPTPARSLLRADAPSVTLCGNVIFSEPEVTGGKTPAHKGMYSFTSAGVFEQLSPATITGTQGAVAVGNVFYSAHILESMGLKMYYYYSYDMDNDFAKIAQKSVKVTQIPSTLAYDGEKVYGCFNKSSKASDGYVFGTINLSTYTLTTICDLPAQWNAAAFDATGQLYVIDLNGKLFKVNKSSGEMSEIGATGFVPKYKSSAVIDQKTGRMYWNVLPADEKSYLCEVNLTTGVATQLCSFAYGDEIMGMYMPYVPEPGAPAEPESLFFNFDKSSLTGTVDFTIPANTYGGTPGEGQVDYRVMAGADTLATGKAAYGTRVKAPVTVKAGLYTFSIELENATGKSLKAKAEIFIGSDTPLAPVPNATWANGVFTISWQPVAGSVNDGYIDPDQVTYTVTRMPEKIVVADNVKATSVTDPVPEPDTYRAFYYTVTATFDGKTSGAGTTPSIGLGSMPTPYLEPFADKTSLEAFTIVDANDDGKTWSYYASSGCPRIQYNSSMPMDDWLISPGIRLEAGKYYRLTLDAWSGGVSWTERFTVNLGTSTDPASMTRQIIADGAVASKTPVEQECWFTVEQSGTYFVGIHAISPKNTFYFYVDNLAVSAPYESGAPGAATDLAVMPGANGALTANISFKAPAIDLAGKQLQSLTRVDVKRNGETVKTFTAPAPGAPLSFTDQLSETGDYTYTITGVNASGEGKSAEVSAYIGVTYPMQAKAVTISETANPGEVTVTWQAPDKDINGNPIDPSLVRYRLVDATVAKRPVIADSLNVLSYTMQWVEANEEQEFALIGVIAYTERGAAEEALTEMIPVGTPYATPYVESFADASLSSYIGISRFGSGNTTWKFFKDNGVEGMFSSDGDNGFAGSKADQLNDAAMLFTAKVDLRQMSKPGFSFSTYNIQGDNGQKNINEIEVCVRVAGTPDWITVRRGTVDELCAGVPNEWCRVSTPLEDYKGKVVQIGIKATCKRYAYTFVDALRVAEMLDHDLSVRLLAPESAEPGTEFNVEARIMNEGGSQAEEYTVDLYRDGVKVASMPGTKTVPGAMAAYKFPQTLTVLDPDSVMYHAIVVYTPDLNSDNNVSDTLCTYLPKPDVPTPTGLVANDNGSQKAILSWSAPQNGDNNDGAMEVNEDFEQATPWNLSGAAGWLFVDRDNHPSGGFQGIELPGITAKETVTSFFVMDPSQVDAIKGNTTFRAHAGNRYIASLFRADDKQVDDWAISPMLSGQAQTITFYAKSYSATYPETMEVLYSTGSRETADFTTIRTISRLSETWTQYSVEIPAGARYFALRCITTGGFMLMIDDVHFMAAPRTLTGYNVYRDGILVNETPLTATTFTDLAAEPGVHSYRVTALYSDKGRTLESRPTEAVTFTSTVASLPVGVGISAVRGAICIDGAAGMMTSVADVSGKTIFAATITDDAIRIPVPAGIYLVRVAGKSVKLIVP